MEKSVQIPKAAWWIGSALLLGVVAVAGIHRALSFDVDLDIWEEATYW